MFYFYLIKDEILPNMCIAIKIAVFCDLRPLN